MYDVTPDHLALIPLLQPKIDLVLLGGGDETVLPSPEVVTFLEQHRIAWEPMNTLNATATFNMLSSEGRSVCAVIIPVTEGPEEPESRPANPQREV